MSIQYYTGPVLSYGSVAMPIQAEPTAPRHFIVGGPQLYSSQKFNTRAEAEEHAKKNVTKSAKHIYEAVLIAEPTTPPVKFSELSGYKTTPAKKVECDCDECDESF